MLNLKNISKFHSTLIAIYDSDEPFRPYTTQINAFTVYSAILHINLNCTGVNFASYEFCSK